MDVKEAEYFPDTFLGARNDKQDAEPERTMTTAQQGKEALKDIAFGSLAGIAGKYVEYPFDTVKVRLQSQPDHLPLRYTGPLDCFRQSLRQHGFLGMYRGVSAPLVGAAVETSSLFFSYRVCQDLAQSTIYSANEPLPLGALATCGAFSGAFTSLLLTPIELVKCKMQVPAQAVTHVVRPSMFAIITSVFKTQGISGFWRGQMGTLFRETGGSAAWFGSYEGVSAAFRKVNYGKGKTMDGQQGEKMVLPIHQQMIAGAAAGMSYNFAFFPADTIKSRMQTEEVVAITGSRPTFWSVGRAIWTQHGLKGLYRGCGITVARSAPSSALIFTMYETLRSLFG
ncbi:mitochondrial ornithine carrier protein AmcA/Ort1 [Myriangium duriaei CBS 260.36]|uniref:Mitochondrial ornithine carrier protein AmcA/Ort1 n=1 Tax=Myriangium duriaei CBS 260.36 TaxID=1168546 RepID=A0A9P4ITZ6_9PEZI|nr:mitochondrial ornithine carrier protein AmcA/Ort1 [Myriangium duriaei CBS 260.36]